MVTPKVFEVLVWDRGWFEPVGVAQSLEALGRMLQTGKIDVRLNGTRLRGGFTLVRMKDRPRQWLLIKQRDESASPGTDIVEDDR